MQNEDILHFFTIKFAYIKKKQYLCIVIKIINIYKQLKIHNYENKTYLHCKIFGAR